MQNGFTCGLPVRTTLNIEDDVLVTPAGQSTPAVAGFRAFAARDGRVVSNAQIDQLSNEAGL